MCYVISRRVIIMGGVLCCVVVCVHVNVNVFVHVYVNVRANVHKTEKEHIVGK